MDIHQVINAVEDMGKRLLVEENGYSVYVELRPDFHNAVKFQTYFIAVAHGVEIASDTDLNQLMLRLCGRMEASLH